MKSLLIAILTILLFAASTEPTAFVTRVYEIDDASCIYLEGSSNINEFTCKCQQKFDPRKMTFETQEGGRVTVFKDTGLKFRTKEMDCNNKALNKDLHQTLKVDKHPYIEILLREVRFHGSELDDEYGWVTMLAEADITVAGVTKTRHLEVEGLQEDPNSFRFISEARFLMSDFNLDPPSPLFGLIKVNNEVNIRFDLFIHLPEQG